MKSFDTTFTQTLTNKFGLSSDQQAELLRLITPPNSWDSFSIKNRKGKTLRTAMCHRDDAKATVILSQGRAQTAEEWSEFAHNMLNHGYNFITYDPQGQGKSYRHNDDNSRHHIDTWQTEIDDLEDVINHMFDYGNLSTLPKILIGHSRGSASALRLFAQKPEIQNMFNCAAHIAPMIDIQRSLKLRIAAPFIISTSKIFNRMSSYAPTQGPLTLDRYLGHMHKITNDPIRRAVQWSLLHENPEQICGGATVGFVNEAFKCTKHLFSKGIPESIKTPTFFALGGKEKIPDNNATLRFAIRMPNAKTRTYEDAQHQVHMEEDKIRNKFYGDLHRFIKKHLPS